MIQLLSPKKISIFLLLAALTLWPLVSLSGVFSEYLMQVVFIAAISLSLLLVILDFAINSQLTWRKNFSDYCLMLVLVVFLISGMLSVSIADSLYGIYTSIAGTFLVFASIVGVFYISKVIFSDLASIKRLLLSLSLGALLSSLLYLGSTFISAINLPLTNAGLGVYLTLGAWCALLFSYLGEKKLSKILSFILSFVLLLLVLILDNSQSLLFLNLTIFLAIIFFGWQQQNYGSKFIISMTAVMIISTLMLFVPLHSLVGITSTVDLTLPWRISWPIMIDSLKQDALFGIGLNEFSVAFYKYKPAIYNLTPIWQIGFTRSTSLLTELIVTTGLIGAISWFGVFGYLTFTLVKKLKNTAVDLSFESAKYYTTSVVFAVVAVSLFISSFLFLHSTPLLIVMAIFFGILSHVHLGEADIVKNISFAAKNIIIYTVVILLICGLFFGGRDVYAKIKVNLLSQNITEESLENNSAQIDSLLQYLPLDARSRFSLANNYLALLQKTAKDDLARIVELKDNVSHLWSQGLVVAGSDYVSYQAARQSMQVAGQITDIQSPIANVFQALKLLDPNNPEYYFGEGMDYLQVIASGQSDPEIFVKAQKSFEKSLELKIDYTYSYLGLAQLYQLQQKPELVELNYTKALSIEPKNKDIVLALTNSLVENKKFELAINLLDRYLQDNPEDQELLDHKKEAQEAQASVEKSTN